MSYETLELYGKFEGSWNMAVVAPPSEKKEKPPAVTTLMKLIAPDN